MASQNPNGYDMIFKVVLIGDTSVGKTNILSKYLSNEFDPDSKATVGVEFGTKDFKIENNIVKVQIWDTAGQERYRSINRIYFQKAQGIILVYDITSRESFEGLGDWIKLIHDNIDYAPIVLIGNKLDDAGENRIVRFEEGRQFANVHDFLFFETSALSGKNVDKAVYALCERIIDHLNNKSTYNYNFSVALSLNDIMKDDKINKTDKKSGCC